MQKEISGEVVPGEVGVGLLSIKATFSFLKQPPVQQRISTLSKQWHVPNNGM